MAAREVSAQVKKELRARQGTSTPFYFGVKTILKARPSDYSPQPPVTLGDLTVLQNTCCVAKRSGYVALRVSSRQVTIDVRNQCGSPMKALLCVAHAICYLAWCHCLPDILPINICFSFAVQYRLWRDLSDITYLGPRVADKIIVGLILMRWGSGCHSLSAKDIFGIQG